MLLIAVKRDWRKLPTRPTVFCHSQDRPLCFKIRTCETRKNNGNMMGMVQKKITQPKYCCRSPFAAQLRPIDCKLRRNREESSKRCTNPSGQGIEILGLRLTQPHHVMLERFVMRRNRAVCSSEGSNWQLLGGDWTLNFLFLHFRALQPQLKLFKSFLPLLLRARQRKR